MTERASRGTRPLQGLVILALFLLVLGRGLRSEAGGGGRPLPELEAFVGSASKPAIEEIAALYERERGVRLVLHFGGSGRMLGQLALGGRGDLFLPGSSDYMQKAVDRDLVLPETIRPVAWLVPAINVPVDNPAGIRNLQDLLRPGVRVGMARPESVCVGLYGREVLQEAGLWERLRPRLATQVDSCAGTARLVALGTVDAVLGWRVFQHWDEKRIRSIPIEPRYLPRIGTIPIAVARTSRRPALAEAFVTFLASEKARAVFRRWHYLASEEEARRHARGDALVSRVILHEEGAHGE